MNVLSVVDMTKSNVVFSPIVVSILSDSVDCSFGFQKCIIQGKKSTISNPTLDYPMIL